jgi:hypothetical protein
MANTRSSSRPRSRAVPPPKVEDNTLDEQHAGIEKVELPVTDNDLGTGESAQTHVRGGSSEERRRRIEFAAYLRAQGRGFAPGSELDDWLAAEREAEQGEGPEKPG